MFLHDIIVMIRDLRSESIMSVKVYNKLVRDRIPDIIEADHKRCV